MKKWTFVLWLVDAGDYQVAHGKGETADLGLQNALEKYFDDIGITPQEREKACEDIDLWCAFAGHHENIANLVESREPVLWRPKATKKIKARLEYLRGELEAERISQDELLELQSLTEYIEPDDVQLLEAAGVPEFEKET